MTSIPPPPHSPLPSSQVNHPRAIGALACAIVGFLVFGIILGVVAIVLAVQARRMIRERPLEFKGDGLAVAGLIIGIIDVAANVAILSGAWGVS